MKAGIKSENHVCTVEIMRHLLDEYFSLDECDLVEKAREARVESQYYTTSEAPAVFEDILQKHVPRFLVKCKGIVDRLDAQKIQKIRDTYKEIIRGDG